MAFFTDYLADPRTRSDLLQQTLEHIALTAIPVLIAVVIGLALGILAQRSPRFRSPILGMVSTFLTIPSLALFAMLIPLVGIGASAPIIALTLYALLPIVRNTLSGLVSVDAAIVESAKGMGMSSTMRLVKIELPIAWPVILAGMRVATLLTVGIAAIAALVGGPGLGQEIFSGIRRIPATGSLESLLGGTILIVVLAVLFDLLYLAIGRLTIPRGIRD
ncbi:MAG: ABC transporter permease [Nitriliruptoraceae bacterium]